MDLLDDTPIECEATATGRLASVLCVDDEPNVLSALRRLLRPANVRVLLAQDGARALEILKVETVDLVISDMRMPGMDGANLLAQVKRDWPDTMRILLTGYADVSSSIAAVNHAGIFRYVTKPWDDQALLNDIRQALGQHGLERDRARLAEEVRIQNEQLREFNARLERTVEARTAEIKQINDFLVLANERLKANFLESVKTFSNLLEMRGRMLAGHSRRVAELARRVGRAMGVSGQSLQDIFLAGLLHDVGKIGLSDEVLSTPVSKMTVDELAKYRKHPVWGEQILTGIVDLRASATLIRSHHERHDGSGFPDGLAGDAIPLGARILALVSDYDDVISGEAWMHRATPEEAQLWVRDGRGHRYDIAVVDAFESVLRAASLAKDTGIRVGISDLVPGMVLSRDLSSHEGILLLTAGHALDERLIAQLQAYDSRSHPLEAIVVRP